MGDPQDPNAVQWYSADPRAVVLLSSFKVSGQLKRELIRLPFEVVCDHRPKEVLLACAELKPKREQTWINTAIVDVYLDLFDQGFMHTVEVQDIQSGQLAGGLYGVALGGVFFGESMFYRASGASKVAAVWLGHHLRSQGYRLLDIQMMTPLWKRLGATEIPDSEYQRILGEGLSQSASFYAN